jgi:small subunit ribosomal protein S17
MTDRAARKSRVGVVVSDARDKTVTVEVADTTRHPRYGKTVPRRKKYHAHDETNNAGMGDTVRIVETRPLSKSKRWRVSEIVERAR